MLELSKGHKLDTYWVRVSYQGASKKLKGIGAKAAWENTIQEISGYFTYTDNLGKKQSGTFNAEEDKPSLDTKPKWKGL